MTVRVSSPHIWTTQKLPLPIFGVVHPLSPLNGVNYPELRDKVKQPLFGVIYSIIEPMIGVVHPYVLLVLPRSYLIGSFGLFYCLQMPCSSQLNASMIIIAQTSFSREE
jgi:hypothetical protein